MNIGKYQMYLQMFVQEAFEQSDGTKSGIASYLYEKKIKGWLVRDRLEKETALMEARKAFDEHRHWPMEIILSHLGVELKENQAG